jgi:Mg-chelatase subunit ChlD
VTRINSQPTAASSPVATCSSSVALTVVTSPTMVPVVESAADAATSSGACATYAVSGQAEVDTVADVAAGTRPDVWIPDSSVWVDDVKAAAPNVPLSAGPSVASSPLVLALPARLGAYASSASWANAVGGKYLMRTAEPARNASGRLALFASYTALGTSDQARIALGGSMIQLSRTAMQSDAALLRRAKDAPDEAEVFPIEESVLAAYLAANPGAPLAGAVPAEGTTQFDHPFLTFTDAAPGVASAADALRAALTSDEGRARAKEGGFRAKDDSDSPVAGVRDGVAKVLPPPPAPVAAALLRSWTNVRVEMKMLAVVDTSGSMKFPAGASSRMVLAHQAGLIALAAFPPASSIGLWQFGYQLGGPEQDWREVVPTRKLADVADGRDQKTILKEGFGTIASMPGGATGLYDTVLGAYRAAQAGYEPGRVNSVVLLTDGFNEDPMSITLGDLVAQLTALRDPARPIVLITVGIGPDADQAVLRQIAGAVGGRAYSAVQPDQIIPVFVDALLARR